MYPKIIDIHAHIYPQQIAQKAISSIGDFYNVKMQNDKGTALDLIESGSEVNVEKYIVHSVATSVNQVPIINDFLAKRLRSTRNLSLSPRFTLT